MSDETPTTTEQPAAEAPEAAPAMTVPVAYEDASRLVTSGGTAQLALFSNVHRDPVLVKGREDRAQKTVRQLHARSRNIHDGDALLHGDSLEEIPAAWRARPV